MDTRLGSNLTAIVQMYVIRDTGLPTTDDIRAGTRRTGETDL